MPQDGLSDGGDASLPALLDIGSADDDVFLVPVGLPGLWGPRCSGTGPTHLSLVPTVRGGETSPIGASASMKAGSGIAEVGAPTTLGRLSDG